MIALVTANIGQMDNIHPVPAQSVFHHHHYFTENNLPYPLYNLSDRLKGKYLKIQTHRFLQEETFVWIDGSVEVISPFFVSMMTEPLGEYDLVCITHPARKSPVEEYEFVLEELANGGNGPHSPYIMGRYAGQPIKEELEWVSKVVEADKLPLYYGGVFARNNNSKVNKAFDEWWSRVIEFSHFDQPLLPVMAELFGLKVLAIPCDTKDKYIKFHNHLR